MNLFAIVKMAAGLGERKIGLGARLGIVLSLLVALAGCESERWYKGNTHAHTVLCGHADSSPEAVTEWYHDHGYHFLCLSEHNQFIDPATVGMPKDLRKDFILIPGEEVTGGAHAHTTALNIQGVVDPRLIQPAGASKTQVMQAHVQGIGQQMGRAILNHPNFHYRNTVEDIRPVKGLHLFELHNGHPQVNNFGDEAHPAVEAMWDQLLTDGMLIYGVSSDDAHAFKTLGPEHSNPGRGWVMVRAKSLTPDAITDALYQGKFYATSGVMLSKVEASLEKLSIAVDVKGTERALASGDVMGHVVGAGNPGFRIDFIGPGGELLESIAGTRGSIAVSKSFAYVRAKVIYSRGEEGAVENFYAWSQPVFTDGRRHFDD